MAFIDGLPDDGGLLPTFTCYRRCWEAFINAALGTHLRVDIPFEDTALPVTCCAWDWPSPAARRRRAGRRLGARLRRSSSP
jgi:hypothetical protein